MAIFKAVVLQGYRRSDGNYNIKIRLYHRKQYRYIPTPWYIPEADTGRGGRIRDPEAQSLADDLIGRMRRRLFALGAAVETMDIDSLVRAVAVPGESPAAFSLDFIAYTRRFAEWLEADGRRGTAGIYRAAANRLADYLERSDIDVSEVTASLLGGFVRWLLQRPARGRQGSGRAPGLYLGVLRAMWRRARQEFNDPEAGRILIHGDPFARIELPRPAPVAKRALTPAQLRAIAALPRRAGRYRGGVCRYNQARDLFLLSFMLMGMNAADLYAVCDFTDGRLTYERAKTRSRRADRALISVAVPPEAMKLLRRYRDPTGRRVFGFYLRYSSPQAFNDAIMHGMAEVGAAAGIDGLQFYAARHSWATIAVNDAGVDRYTVHEALNHAIPEMKITDMYIRRDWRHLDEANRRVLDFLQLPAQ